MSTALERRLQRALGRLPQPNRAATRRARAAALATLPPEERRGALVLVFVAAAVAVAVAAGAGALAATGNLHVQLGRKQPRPHPPPAHLQVPHGTNGIAVMAGGRLWLATRRGLRIEGMPVSAAELSPRALYAVVGVGSALVAFAPGPRRAWTQDTGGRVVEAAWSPDGLKIAYVVRRREGTQLRLIEGDGDHDRLLAPRAAVAKPSWRADSLAVAYVRPDGQAAVYDLTLARRRTFETRSCSGRAQELAYARNGRRLIVGGVGGVSVVGRWDRPYPCVALARHWFAWNDDGSLFIVGRRDARAGLAVVTAAPRGNGLAFALYRRRGVVDVMTGSPARRLAARLLLRLHVARGGVELSWR